MNKKQSLLQELKNEKKNIEVKLKLEMLYNRFIPTNTYEHE